MARQSEGEWYRASADAWYATVNGKKKSLGVKGKANRKQARAAWLRLMTEPEPAPKHDDTFPGRWRSMSRRKVTTFSAEKYPSAAVAK